MSKSQPIEVWCPACRTTFAPETRRCVHCGGPVARGRALASQSSPGDSAGVAAGGSMGTPPSTVVTHGAAGPFPAEEPDDLESLTRGRSPIWIVTAVLIMLASMLRNCLGS